jgi:hypothetical protein
VQREVAPERAALRWSEQFLASEAGLSIVTIVNFEHERHQVRPGKRVLIAAVFASM